MSDLNGINLAMQTPMHEDGSIDFARWQELIDIYIDTGVQGIVLGAGTGADVQLDRRFEEIELLVEPAHHGRTKRRQRERGAGVDFAARRDIFVTDHITQSVLADQQTGDRRGRQ